MNQFLIQQHTSPEGMNMKEWEWYLVNNHTEKSITIYWKGYLPQRDCVWMKVSVDGMD